MPVDGLLPFANRKTRGNIELVIFLPKDNQIIKNLNTVNQYYHSLFSANIIGLLSKTCTVLVYCKLMCVVIQEIANCENLYKL